jgi:hypothetical protein
MGVQAIDPKKIPEISRKTRVFYCLRSTTEGDKTLWSFTVPREFFLKIPKGESESIY